MDFLLFLYVYPQLVVFATKECVCCDFQDTSAYVVSFATKMRICCDFHDNNCVFGISGSNSSVSQVFSAHTCTIHWILPTKNSKQRPFQVLRKKIRFYEFRQTPPFVNFIHKIPFFLIDGFP